MRNLAPTALAGVVAVDCLLAQRGRQLFQRTRLPTAQEQHRVHVSDDRVRVVFIQGFELRLRLKDQAARNLS